MYNIDWSCIQALVSDSTACSIGWISTSHAAASQSISIVTAYDTLGPSGVEHSLVQTECSAMYVDSQLLKTASEPIKKSSVKTVIVNDRTIFAKGGELEAFRADHPDLKIVTLEELRQLGEDNPVEPNPAKPSDLYCIMYTSGSTGLPKGACITHEALIAGGELICTILRPLTNSFLLSHQFVHLCRRMR